MVFLALRVYLLEALLSVNVQNLTLNSCCHPVGLTDNVSLTISYQEPISLDIRCII